MPLTRNLPLTGPVPVTNAVVPAYPLPIRNRRCRQRRSLFVCPGNATAWMAGTSPAKVNLCGDQI